MPTGPSSSLPVELQQKLSRLQSRIRTLNLFRGAGKVAVVVVIACALALLMDAQWQMSDTARVLLTLASLGAIAGSGWYWLIRPLSNATTNAELAAIVERSHPELMERLSSTVELNSPESESSFRGSRYMRDALTDETVAAVSKVEIPQSVPIQQTQRWAITGLTALILLLAPFFWLGSGYSLLWARFFNPRGNYDRATNLYFEVAETDQVVGRGDDVVISATPQWRTSKEDLPAQVHLNWTYDAGESDSLLMPFDPMAETYSATRMSVLADFQFDISCPDTRTKQYQIRVVERPEVTAAIMQIQPPAYSGLPAESIDGVVGDVAVFERSHLSLTLEFNKPVVSAVWCWLDVPKSEDDDVTNAAPVEAENFSTEAERTETRFGDEHAAAKTYSENGWPAPVSEIPLQISEDGYSAKVELMATQQGRFSFVATDEHGLTNLIEPRRNLVITPDAPPKLILDGDDRPLELRLDEPFALQVAATDDLGLGALELHFEIYGQAGERGVLEMGRGQLGKTEVIQDFLLDFPSFGLPNFTVVKYRIRAADERALPHPNVVWSKTRKITLRNDAKSQDERNLANRHETARELISGLQQNLAKQQESVDQAREQAERDGRNGNDVDRKDELQELSKQAIQSQARQLAARFAEHPLFANLTDETVDLAEQELNAIDLALDWAKDAAPRERMENLADASRELNSAREKLDAIAEEFEELAQLEQELLELDDFAQRAEELAEEALGLNRQREQLPAESERNAEQQHLANELQQEQERLQLEQQDLTDRFNDLLARLPELQNAIEQQKVNQLNELSSHARDIAEPQDLLAEALRKDADEVRDALPELSREQEEILREAEQLAQEAEQELAGTSVAPLDPDELRKALENLKAGNLDQAADDQQRAADELKRLSRELQENVNLPDDPQEAVEQLADRQREIAEAAEELAEQAAEQNPNDQQRDALEREQHNLAAKQASVQVGLSQLDLPTKHRNAQQQAIDQSAESLQKMVADEPEDAKQAAADAHRQLKELARSIGSQEERQQAAYEELATLRKEQAALKAEAEELLKRDAENRQQSSQTEQLEQLAKRQRELAEELAKLDSPMAEDELRKALEDQAAAINDLGNQREQNIPTSLEQAEQGLANLEKKLAGEQTAEESVEEHLKQQQDLNRQTVETLQKPDLSEELAQQAEQQQELAEEIAALDVPAAERERDEAVESMRQAAEQLRKSAEQNSGEQQQAARQSQNDAAESLQNLQEALAQRKQSPRQQAERLADRQRAAAQESKQRVDENQPQTLQQREQTQNELADLIEDVERLRVGDTAQQEKEDALETLQKAQQAQEAVAEAAAKREQQAKDSVPTEQNPAPQENGNAPPPIEEELQRLMKEDAQAQADAAEALEDLKRKFDGEPAQREQQEQQRAEDEELAQLLNEDGRQQQEELEQLADLAGELAEEQAKLERQTERTNDLNDPDDRREALQQLAQEQRELAERAAKLDQSPNPLKQAEAQQQMQQAGESLQKEQTVPAQQYQKSARQTLREISQHAKQQAENLAQQQASAGDPSQSDSTRQAKEEQKRAAEELSRRAEELARRQQGLQKEVAGQLREQQEDMAEIAQQQQELAKKAAEMTLDIAREQGTNSPATKKAAELARHAAQAAEKTQQGQLDQAQQAAQQAASSAQQAAGEVEKANSDKQQLAEGLAKEQADLAEQMNQAANQPGQRINAQQSGQEQLAKQAEQLAQQLEQAAAGLQDGEKGESPAAQQTAEQLKQAQERVERAQHAMQQAAEQLQQGQRQDASRQGQQAAEAMQQVAQRAERAAQALQQAVQQPGQSDGRNSPIPNKLAEQIAEATEQFRQARQQLAESNGQQSGALQQMAQNLQQAAQALSDASARIPTDNPPSAGSPSPGQPGGNPSSGNTSSQPGSQGSGDGRDARGPISIQELDQKLKRMEARNWGQLPGHIKNEVLQGSKKKSNGDYAKQIKLYFKEIAGAKTE